MVQISVPDMMCENCVKRITAALKEIQVPGTVSLAEKTVTLTGNGQEHLSAALEALEDLGFTPAVKP